MKRAVVCSGGGIRACAFTLGVMSRVRQYDVMYTKSGSAWAGFLIKQMGVANAKKWVLSNMDDRSKVMDFSLWGIWQNKYIFTYGPLLKKFKAIERRYGGMASMKYKAISQDVLRKHYVEDLSADTAISSSTLLGIHKVERQLFDLAGEGFYPTQTFNGFDEIVFIDAYNQDTPGSPGILGGIMDQVERPLNYLSRDFVEDINRQHPGKLNWVQVPTSLRVGIADFDKDAIEQCFDAGYKMSAGVI